MPQHLPEQQKCRRRKLTSSSSPRPCHALSATPARLHACTLHCTPATRYSSTLYAPPQASFKIRISKSGRVYLAVRLHAKALVRWRGRVSVLLHALRYVQTGMSACTKRGIAKASVRKEADKSTTASTQVRNEPNKPKQAGNQILDSIEHSWRRCMVEGLAGLLGALSLVYLVLSFTCSSLLPSTPCSSLRTSTIQTACPGTTRCNIKDITSMRA
jgi:hypothetical protein